MALQITQGTLPADGAEVDPATFLETWIGGVNVWNFPPGVFKGGTLQFVWCQSEAPRADERFAGLLWFKRGEGRLYMWDQPDLPSTLTFADAGWVALSDRKELWCYAREPIPYGAPVHLSTYQECYVTSDDQYMTGECNPRPIWVVDRYGSTTASNYVQPLNWVAMESADSGTLFRVCDLGFCDILCPSGESGNHGTMVLDEKDIGAWHRIDPTAGSACRYMPLAQTVDSSATDPGAEWVRPVFKHQMPFIGIDITQ